MRPLPRAVSLVILAGVLCSLGCGSGSSKQPFDKAKWNAGRQQNPERNECPAMLHDLMERHLSLGMALTDVTNLLGHPEVKTSLGAATRVRGEFIEQVAYTYQPGIHNGWLVEGTNPLVLLFGQRGEYLREWSPLSVAVRPVSATNSEAARATARTGRLPLGHSPITATPPQFDALLGPPDEKCTEWQLDYFLGKPSRFAWDTVFLELHFNKSNRLSRMTRSEH
jgi:hypothetical protein